MKNQSNIRKTFRQNSDGEYSYTGKIRHDLFSLHAIDIFNMGRMSLVTHPMLQLDQIARSYDRWILILKFYVDSKNVSKKFLHRHYPVLKKSPFTPPPHPPQRIFSHPLGG